MSACPVCAGSASNGFEKLYSCPKCMHIYQYPPDIKVSYDKDYVDHYNKCDTSDLMSHLRLGLLKSFTTAGRLLDVGYGNGCFVKLALKAGFNAFGSDVHGVDCGVRERPLVDESKWDVVTFFDSLEHFPDLSEAKHLIDRARLVLVSMPNRPDRLEAFKTWKHYKPGEHLHYFGNDSLDCFMHPKRLLSRSDVEDVIRGKLGGVAQNIFTSVYG